MTQTTPRSGPAQARRWSGREIGWTVVGVALAVALIAFIVQNTESVSFDWLFWSFRAPLWLMLVATGLVAFAIGQIALLWRRHRRRAARRAARD